MHDYIKYKTVKVMVEDLINGKTIENSKSETHLMNDINTIFRLLKELKDEKNVTDDVLADFYYKVYFYRATIFLSKAGYAAERGSKVFDNISSVGTLVGNLIGKALTDSAHKNCIMQALSDLDKAQAYYDDQHVRYMKGICHKDLSNKSKAKEEFEICIKQDPITDIAVKASIELERMGSVKPVKKLDPEEIKKREAKNIRTILIISGVIVFIMALPAILVLGCNILSTIVVLILGILRQ